MSLITTVRLKYMLCRLSKSANVSYIGAPIEKLGALGDRRAIQPLLDVLASGKGDCGKIATALAHLKATEAIEPLLASVGRSWFSGTDRKTIAVALEALGQPQWVTIIQGDDGDWQRITASGDDNAYLPLSGVVEMIGSIKAEKRREVLQAVIALHDKRVIPSLIKVLGIQWISSDSAFERVAVAGTLAGLGEPKWGTLVHGNDNDWKALGDCGDSRAMMALQNALDDIDEHLRTSKPLGIFKLGRKHGVKEFSTDHAHEYGMMRAKKVRQAISSAVESLRRSTGR